MVSKQSPKHFAEQFFAAPLGISGMYRCIFPPRPADAAAATHRRTDTLSGSAHGRPLLERFRAARHHPVETVETVERPTSTGGSRTDSYSQLDPNKDPNITAGGGDPLCTLPALTIHP